MEHALSRIDRKVTQLHIELRIWHCQLVDHPFLCRAHNLPGDTPLNTQPTTQRHYQVVLHSSPWVLICIRCLGTATDNSKTDNSHKSHNKYCKTLHSLSHIPPRFAVDRGVPYVADCSALDFPCTH